MSTDTANLADLLTAGPVPNDDVTPAGDDNVSHCRVCGTGIDHLYGGRGKRPVLCEDHKKDTASKISSGTRGNTNAKLAADAIDDAYSMVALGLMFFAPGAASVLAASREGQKEKNLAFLSKDPELCKAINKVGKTGGRFAFFASQAMLLAPVVILATTEMRQAAILRGEDTLPENAPFSQYGTPA